jgi:hypothetical protein
VSEGLVYIAGGQMARVEARCASWDERLAAGRNWKLRCWMWTGATRGRYRSNTLAGRPRIMTNKLPRITCSFVNYLSTTLIPPSYFLKVPMVTSMDG